MCEVANPLYGGHLDSKEIDGSVATFSFHQKASTLSEGSTFSFAHPPHQPPLPKILESINPSIAHLHKQAYDSATSHNIANGG